MSYIYITTNKINNKRYIGKCSRDSKNSKYYLGGGMLLSHAIKKYGKKNFEKKVIVEGDFNTNLLNDLEIHYIRLYNADNSDMFYNISKGGNYDKKCVTEYISTKAVNRIIYVYNEDGTLLNTFNGINSAALYYNMDRVVICGVVNKNKKRRSYYFCDDINLVKKVPKFVPTGTFCYMFNIDGIKINKFDTIKGCARETGIPLEKVRNAIKNRCSINNQFYILKTDYFRPNVLKQCTKPFVIYNDNECLIFYKMKEFLDFIKINKTYNLNTKELIKIAEKYNYTYKTIWK